MRTGLVWVWVFGGGGGREWGLSFHALSAGCSVGASGGRICLVGVRGFETGTYLCRVVRLGGYSFYFFLI